MKLATTLVLCGVSALCGAGVSVFGAPESGIVLAAREPIVAPIASERPPSPPSDHAAAMGQGIAFGLPADAPWPTEIDREGWPSNSKFEWYPGGYVKVILIDEPPCGHINTVALFHVDGQGHAKAVCRMMSCHKFQVRPSCEPGRVMVVTEDDAFNRWDVARHKLPTLVFEGGPDRSILINDKHPAVVLGGTDADEARVDALCAAVIKRVAAMGQDDERYSAFVESMAALFYAGRFEDCEVLLREFKFEELTEDEVMCGARRLEGVAPEQRRQVWARAFKSTIRGSEWYWALRSCFPDLPRYCH